MKIALFDSEASLGGAQRFLLDLASGLRARRWEVIAVLGTDGPLQRAFAARDVPVILAPLAPGQLRWHAVPRLASFFYREGIRRVYANSLHSAILGSLAVRLIGGRNCWRIYPTLNRTEAPRLARIAARLSSQLHVTTPDLAEELRTACGKHAPVQVVPPAIDLAQFPTPDPPAPKRGERPVIGIIGCWTPPSGQEVLVKAFRLLHESGQPARLRLAHLRGNYPLEEGRYRSVVQSAVKAAGLEDRIIFEGEITNIPGFLAGCDVVVAPTLRATTGRLVLEAAAAGRPVIATPVAGYRDLVEDGHTGLLVPEHHPQALADALALLLASPALRMEMGRQARLHAERAFNMETLLDQLEEQFLGIPPQAWRAHVGS